MLLLSVDPTPESCFHLPGTSSFFVCNCISQNSLKNCWWMVLSSESAHFTAIPGCSYVNIGKLTASDLFICECFVSVHNSKHLNDDGQAVIFLEKSAQVLFVLKMPSTYCRHKWFLPWVKGLVKVIECILITSVYLLLRNKNDHFCCESWHWQLRIFGVFNFICLEASVLCPF